MRASVLTIAEPLPDAKQLRRDSRLDIVGVQSLSHACPFSRRPVAVGTEAACDGLCGCRTDAEASSSVGPGTFGFAFPKMRCMLLL